MENHRLKMELRSGFPEDQKAPGTVEVQNICEYVYELQLSLIDFILTFVQERHGTAMGH